MLGGLFLLALVPCVFAKYEPNWNSLDKRPLPQWYDDAKFGIFIVWGVYSVPSIISEWFWWYWQGPTPSKEAIDFMQENYPPRFTYPDFGPQFTAEFFDPNKFAEIIKASGAKYVVLTTKHAEGFTLWPSNYSWNWNSMDVGPKRDLVGELRDAVKNIGGIHFGLYFCQYEWFNPLYLKDKSTKFSAQQYVKMVTMPQMYEIVNNYQPDVFWSDGDYEAPFAYWNSTHFLAWLYNDSPVKETVVVNDRWGIGTTCKHGDFLTCTDKYDPGHLIPHKWENCLTVDSSSWGFRRTMTSAQVLTLNQLITKLARTISCGGNMLLNVGPTHDGRIVPIFEERLRQLGHWLGVNGQAVYGTKPWVHQNDTLTQNIWYTSKLKSGPNKGALYNPQKEKDTVVYTFVLDWPTGGTLKLGATKSTNNTTVYLLGYGKVPFKAAGVGLQIELGGIPFDRLPSTTAWVLKLNNLAAQDRNPIQELKELMKNDSVY